MILWQKTTTGDSLCCSSVETLRSRSEKQLMDKLEELCARQARRVSPHCRQPSAKLSSSQEQQENKK